MVNVVQSSTKNTTCFLNPGEGTLSVCFWMIYQSSINAEVIRRHILPQQSSDTKMIATLDEIISLQCFPPRTSPERTSVMGYRHRGWTILATLLVRGQKPDKRRAPATIHPEDACDEEGRSHASRLVCHSFFFSTILPKTKSGGVAINLKSTKPHDLHETYLLMPCAVRKEKNALASSISHQYLKKTVLG